MIVNCTIDDDSEGIEVIGKLDMTDYQHSPHQDAFGNSLAKDIHFFIQQATWNVWPTPSHRSGTTWIELFARFDTQGYRRVESIQSNDSDAKHRFLLRSSKAKRTRGPNSATSTVRAAVRPG